MFRWVRVHWRILVIIILVAAGFGLIGWRLVNLHVLDRTKYVNFLIELRQKVVVERARRGDILDARGVILASSRSMLEVGVDPSRVLENLPEAELRKKAMVRINKSAGPKLKDAELEAEISRVSRELLREDSAKRTELARLLGVPEEELRKKFVPSFRRFVEKDGKLIEDVWRWHVLKKEVDEVTYRKVMALGASAVRGERYYLRTYPHNQLAAHVIGFTNKENKPVMGVESFADYYLQGKDGWRESEKDVRENERAEFLGREVSAVPGFTVQLTIDSVVQHVVEEEIANIVREFSPKRVSIIVSDPQTGFILALGNYPTFNPNNLKKASEAGMRNWSVDDAFDPGSTFKIVPIAGALNEGRVTPETSFDCKRTTIEYRGITRRLMRDDHPSDHPLSVAEILAQSSNAGTPQVAMAMGNEKFCDYVRVFGFGEKTGYQVKTGTEEVPGRVMPLAKWSAAEITRIPVGYSITVTAMQMHFATAAIASGGKLLSPQIILRVSDLSGSAVVDAHPNVRRTVVTPQTAETMKKLMRGVVTDGTGKRADIPGYEVAGKTGTAQKLIAKKYSNKHHVGSFIGFFPASRPRVVISVIVDEGRPQNGSPGYGGTVAAPSFKRIGSQLAQYLDIKPVDERDKLPLRQPSLAGGGLR